jgi:hypothetical protein
MHQWASILHAEDEEEGDDVGWENEVYTFTEAPEEISSIVADPKGKKKKVVTASGVTVAGADPKKTTSAVQSGARGRTIASPRHGRR